MNGNSNGIVPTIDLATNNGGYGSNGFFGGDGIWFLVILALLFNGGWGGFGGFGGGLGGFGMMNGFYEFPWLLNGQQGINNNVNNGFDNLHLSNQIEGIRDGIAGLSNQLCNCCSDMNQTVSNGFYNAEIAANNRQVADMNQNFSNQIATLSGFNNLNTSLLNASADNRLGIANLNSTILSENCADRYEAAKNTRDIIDNATGNTRAILDKLCQLELDGVKSQLDAKNDRIADLQREISMKDLAASQIEQTAQLRAAQATTANQLVSELRSCPIPSQPVYGNQPIFTCPNNLGVSSGCGCSGYSTNII